MVEASSGAKLPTSLRALLPRVWSEVLFPGAAPAAGRPQLTALLLLIVVPGLLLYPCLGFHLFEPDEGRYAEIPREMLAAGEWVIPQLQGQPYLDKPPLLYWLVMLSYQLFGVDDWSARLAPALAVHLCVLIVYLLGMRSLGERPAFWGALLLGLAPGFLGVGRLLLLDGLLSLWVTLEIFCAFEAVRGGKLQWGWWLLAAGACGLGVLTKGPVALVLLLPPLWLYSRLTRWRAGDVSPPATSLSSTSPGDLRPPLANSWGDLGWKPLVLYAVIAMSLSLPWYAAITWRLPEFPRYFFWEHNIVRFSQGFDHLQPFWFYLPIVFGGLLPGSLLAFGLVRFLLSSDEAVRQRRCPELAFMLLAGGWCVAFFSLSECKLPTYVLPAFPPLALALGYYLVHSRWQQTRWPMAVCTVFFVMLLGAHYVAVPRYAEHRSPWRRPATVTAYCGDPDVPVVCYPRNCDSVAFYLGRGDLRSYRSKQTPELLEYLQTQPRVVVLFTHRHSLEALRQVLTPPLRLSDETPLFGSAKPGAEGLCYMAVVRSSASLPRERGE